VALGVVAAGLALVILRPSRVRVLTGVILRQEEDPRKQVPIANAAISATDGVSTVSAHTDAAGLFRLSWRPRVLPGETITLQLRHSDYQPLDIADVDASQLYVFRMIPMSRKAAVSDGPPVRGRPHLFA
jgi:hypothetical protein